MKTAGIILILFSGTGLGLCKSMELTARLKILEKLAQLLLLLKGEIRCTGATLEAVSYTHLTLPTTERV